MAVTYRQVTSKFDQQVFDLAIQEYGGVEGVFDLIEDNYGVIDNVDVDLEVGTVVNIKVDGSTRTNKDNQSYYNTKQIDVVTGTEQAGDLQYLLLEDGTYLLQENGSKILL